MSSSNNSTLKLDPNGNQTCVINGTFYYPPTYPTLTEFYDGLGGYAIALFVTTSLNVIIQGVRYGMLAHKIFKNVPQKQIVAMLWINSVFLIASIMAFLGVVTPKASDFLWLSYRVYLGFVIAYVVELTIVWHGGQKEMVERLKDHAINMRVMPCCCICCLPRATPLSRNKIRLLKACVNQLAYIQTVMIFMLIVLNLSGDLEIGNMSPDDPYFYINIIQTISFFIGLWSLFTLFGIEATYEFLHIHKYKKKAIFLKLVITLSNLQAVIVDSLVKHGVIPCAGALISSNTVGSIIKSILTMIETITMGAFMFHLYHSDTGHV